MNNAAMVPCRRMVDGRTVPIGLSPAADVDYRNVSAFVSSMCADEVARAILNWPLPVSQRPFFSDQ